MSALLTDKPIVYVQTMFATPGKSVLVAGRVPFEWLPGGELRAYDPETVNVSLGDTVWLGDGYLGVVASIAHRTPDEGSAKG